MKWNHHIGCQRNIHLHSRYILIIKVNCIIFFRWENGKPVGKSALIDMGDGPRKSVIVPDPRIPTNWTKHLVQRTYGASAGKWDCIIVSPEGRRFRTKSEVKIYIDDHPDYNLTDSMFDFSIHRSGRGKKRSSAPPPQQHPQREQSPVESKPVEEGNYLIHVTTN